MSLVPDELIYEILVKLPIKSLMRFRCVCKLWKNLTSHPLFVKDHLHTLISNAIITHQRLAYSLEYNGRIEILTCSVRSLFENPSTPAETLPFKMECKYEIIGSFNGLMCLHHPNGCFKLWNPSTRLSSKTSPHIDCHGWLNLLGFGYDQVNDKYKLVVYMDNPNMARVHTFGTNYWKRIPGPSCHLYDRRDKVGKYVNGTLNWLAKRVDDLSKVMILSFDLENETYCEVLLPPQLARVGSGRLELHVLSNFLCLCQASIETHNWDLWLMKEYGVHKSWTKLVMIPREIFYNYDKVILPQFQPLCILENGVILLRVYLSHLVLYDSNNGSYVHCRATRGPWLGAWIYHESLVLP